MGFRFKKSFNIGKHFKINLSKSGIGYSFGVKGFRIGKTAKGKTEKTLSLPGTGLSYKTIKKEDGLKEFTLQMGELTDDEREIILKGCLINYNRVN